VDVPRTASGVPDERNPNTDAERGQIQYNHNQSKQIHSHRQSDCGVHCQNTNQPKEPGLLDPNENRIPDLNQADCNSENRQRVLESDQYIRGKKIKRWPYQRSPEIGPIPPTAAEKFRQASEKIDKAQVDLQYAPPKAQQLRSRQFCF
jgi:hypothetical protein